MSIQGPLPAYLPPSQLPGSVPASGSGFSQPMQPQGYAQPPGQFSSVQLQEPLQTDGIQFDRFRQQQCKPVLTETPQDKANARLHATQYQQFQQMNVAEGPVQTIKMANQILHSLDPLTQWQFKELLNKGVITRPKSDDGHSALYHLYGILTTRRAPGYDNKTILRETIQVLSKPYTISQRFAPLGPNIVQQLMQIRNNPGLNRDQIPPPIQPLNPQDLNVESSATCVASSVMYYMADKEPAGLARHINELTSPLNAFFEKARFEEISPDAPQQALQVLQEHQIPYFVSGPGEVTVKVVNPPAGVARAVASQNLPTGNQYRNAIGAAYQSAITYLVTHSYDPASDLRDSDTPGETSKGLTEAEKTMMEAIIKDNGGVQSVTYQAVNNKANPAPGEENNSYLFGYNRSFEKTTNDILKALELNEPVIIGTTDTDETGAIVAGHEIAITGSYIDQQDGQRKFIVADSDDNIPEPVVKSARELIPTIHHAGLPIGLARSINQEIKNNQGYLIPDAQDQANFTLLSQAEGPMPTDPPVEDSPAQPIANQPTIGQPNIEWVPASQVYPTAYPAQPSRPAYPPASALNNPFSRIPTANPFTNPLNSLPQPIAAAAD